MSGCLCGSVLGTLSSLFLEVLDVHVFSRMKESTGWQQVFTSPRLDWMIDRVALNARVMGGSLGDNDKMVAVASVTEIILWAICPDGNGNEIGTSLTPPSRHRKTSAQRKPAWVLSSSEPNRVWFVQMFSWWNHSRSDSHRHVEGGVCSVPDPPIQRCSHCSREKPRA